MSMPPRPPKLPESVLVLIHSPEAEVLLLERADRPGWWQSVTGSRDTADEPLTLTATRELKEETGIAIGAEALRDWRLANRYEIYPRWRHRYADGVTHNTEHVYSVQVPRDTVVALNAREHIAWAWWPWHEAAERCFSPSNAEACRALPARLAGAA